MGDEEQLFVRVPSSLKYLVDEDDRTNKAIVIAALERELGVNSAESMAVLDRKIRRKEQRLEEELEAAREARDRVTRLKEDLEEIRELREEKADAGQDYESALDTVLNEMEAGELPQLWANHPRVDDLRGEFDRSNEEVHFDLRRRAAGQERDLLNTDFMEMMHAKQQRRTGNEQPIAEAFDGSGAE